jgi:hypothetical protein
MRGAAKLGNIVGISSVCSGFLMEMLDRIGVLRNALAIGQLRSTALA